MNRKAKLYLNLFYISIILVTGYIIFNIYNDKYEFYIEKNDMTLILGNDYEINITPKDYLYNDISNYIITTSDASILEIKDNIITPLKEGNTIVKIKSNKGFHNKKININVTNDTVNTITVPDNINMLVGEEYKINAIVNNDDKVSINLDYEVLDKNIINVDNLGNIKALKSGSTKIKVSGSGINKTIDVVVNEKITEPELELNIYNATLNVGQSIEIKSNIDNLYYVSSDETVATVKNNTIIALSNGNVIINVYTTNGVKKSINITVLETSSNDPKPVDKVESISIPSTLLLEVGQSKKIDVVIKPSNITDVTWVSSNNNIAIVNNGVITAISDGTCIITASSFGKTTDMIVTVTPKVIESTSISIDKTNETIIVGKYVKLNATINPSNVTDKNITWTSSNESIAKVNSNGKVTGISPGSVVITAQTNNGKIAKSNITVKENKVSITSINLDKSNETINVGSSIKLNAIINPSNATDKNIIWTSSNESIAKVNNGEVTGINQGSVIITARTNNGLSATANINVIKTNTKRTIQLLKDTNFDNGFALIHNFNPNVEFTKYGCAFCKNTQYYFIYNANNAPNLETQYVENGKNYVSALQNDGTNDKLVVFKNGEVTMDINTFGKTYSPNGNTWPHLLVTSAQDSLNGLRNQRVFKNSVPLDEQKYYYLDNNSNNIIFSLDIKLNGFKKGNSINNISAAQFLSYLEIYCKADECMDSQGNSKLFWFGFNLFDDRSDNQGFNYSFDEHTKSTVTALSTSSIYCVNNKCGSEYSIYNNGNFSYDWHHVEVNVTDKIKEMVDRINNSGMYTKKLTPSDFWFGGFNIGYEIHGEYWISMSFKNLRLTSTDK